MVGFVRSRGWLLAVVLVSGATVATVGAGATAGAEAAVDGSSASAQPRQAREHASEKQAGRSALPVIGGDFADPTVAGWDGRFVAVATGRLAPRAVAPTPAGPWHRIAPALDHVPRWAAGKSIWASDLVEGPDGWLLYFSAPARGLGPDGRCIGVATAANPTASFRPTGRPLVCPSAARGPAASDPVNPPGVPTPAGVIDPDSYRSPGGRMTLTYRTQGLPATIRVVRLARSGLRAVGGPGTTLVASTDVIENPVLIKRSGSWVLITSEGYFGGCGYRTTFRRASTLAGLALAPRHHLLDRSNDGLCGPGGADLTGSVLFFHSWTCPVSNPRCKGNRDYLRHAKKYGARRSLFAARLTWSPSGNPRIASFVVPAVAQGVVSAIEDVIPAPGAPAATAPGAPATAPGPVGGLLGGLLPGLGG